MQQAQIFSRLIRLYLFETSSMKKVWQLWEDLPWVPGSGTQGREDLEYHVKTMLQSMVFQRVVL